jgi:hypothetical protein
MEAGLQAEGGRSQDDIFLIYTDTKRFRETLPALSKGEICKGLNCLVNTETKTNKTLNKIRFFNEHKSS